MSPTQRMTNLILLSVMLVAGLCRAEVRVENTKYMRWEALAVDNGLIRVVILPDLGGRIIEYYSHLTKHNLLRVVPWHLKMTPEELEARQANGEYGGIFDLPTVGWPGDFWDKKYAFEVTRIDGGVVLTGRCEQEGIGIERRMEIKDQSTRLRFRTVQKNLSKSVMDMVVRLHGEFRVGERADENDTCYWMADGKLQKRKYRTSDEVRLARHALEGGWVGIADSREGEALIRTFQPPNTVHKVFWWGGFHEADPALYPEYDEEGGFYGLGRFPDGIRVEPGKTLEMEEDVFTVSGLKGISFVEGGLVGCLVLSKPVAGEDGTDVSFELGSPEEIKAWYELRVSVQGPDSKERPVKTSEIGGCPAGQGKTVVVHVPGKDLADGDYRVVAGLYSGQNPVAKASEPLQIDRETQRKCVALVKEEERLLDKLPGKKGYPHADWRTILSSFIEDQRKNLAAGNYAVMEAAHKRICGLFAKANAALAEEELTEKNILKYMNQGR